MPFNAPAADAPLFVVLNAAAGREDGDAAREAIEQVLKASGRVHRIVGVDDTRQLRAIARQTVQRAIAVRGVVVAAGGDGTLNTVAQAVHGSGCAFGALPQGTFNLFGRVHGLPTDPAEATRALLRGRVRPVQIGLVNERVFLVNASLGMYPDLLEDREAWKARLGRNRLVALGAGIVSLLRHDRQLRLAVAEGDGPPRVLRTSTLFVTNNRLQLDRLGVEEADRLDEGRLVALMLQPVGLWAKLGLAVRGAIGRLGDADQVHAFDFRSLTVEPVTGYGARGMAKVSADGEVMWLRAPLEFRVAPEPLYLLAPEEAAQAQDVEPVREATPHAEDGAAEAGRHAASAAQ